MGDCGTVDRVGTPQLGRQSTCRKQAPHNFRRTFAGTENCELCGAGIVDRPVGTADMAYPCPQTTANPRCATVSPPVGFQRFEPALRDLLAAVHGDLDQLVEKGRVGKPINKAGRIGFKVLTRRNCNRRCGFPR